MNAPVPAITTKTSKKEVRKLVYDKLADALAEYKPVIPEKKFASNLKKLSKLFAADITKNLNQKNGKPGKKTKSSRTTGLQSAEAPLK